MLESPPLRSVNTTVRYNPTIEGSHQANLEVLLFGSNAPQAVSTLTGQIEETPASFAFSPIPFQIQKNRFIPLQIEARDTSDNLLTLFNEEIDLKLLSDLPSIDFAIKLTEVNPGAPDSVELSNTSNTPIDVSNWSLFIYESISSTSSTNLPRNTFTFPANTPPIPANSTFTITESGTSPGLFPQFFTSFNIGWGSSSEKAVIIVNQAEEIIDVVTSTPELTLQIPGLNGMNPTTVPVSSWSGPGTIRTLALNQSLLRTGSLDNNNASDWNSGSPSTGIKNDNLSIQTSELPEGVELVTVPAPPIQFTNGIWSGTFTIREKIDALHLTASVLDNHRSNSSSFEVVTTPLTDWLPQHYSLNEINDDSLVSLSTDTDNDGFTLFQEFALNLDPNEFSEPLTSRLTSMQDSFNFGLPTLSIEFQLRNDIPDISSQFQHSDNLLLWSDYNPILTHSRASPDNPHYDIKQIFVPIFPEQPKDFFRIVPPEPSQDFLQSVTP